MLVRRTYLVHLRASERLRECRYGSFLLAVHALSIILLRVPTSLCTTVLPSVILLGTLVQPLRTATPLLEIATILSIASPRAYPKTIDVDSTCTGRATSPLVAFEGCHALLLVRTNCASGSARARAQSIAAQKPLPPTST